MVKKICQPAILYIVLSITQILNETYQGMYNTAFFKFNVMVIFAIGLNMLCSRGVL